MRCPKCAGLVLEEFTELRCVNCGGRPLLVMPSLGLRLHERHAEPFCLKRLRMPPGWRSRHWRAVGDYVRERDRQEYYQMRAQGHCTDCHQPRDREGALCQRCADKKSARVREKRRVNQGELVH